jgi:hypothetical protein
MTREYVGPATMPPISPFHEEPAWRKNSYAVGGIPSPVSVFGPRETGGILVGAARVKLVSTIRMNAIREKLAATFFMVPSDHEQRLNERTGKRMAFGPV